ncbi:MAG: hypothetical protein JO022_16230 [Acidobacteriaceae bacterium]|nr:hypothetical protein [Acidobacteriaceae bacterium]
MTAVFTQRCLLHSAREAVARCPQCRNYFCRECVTEHDQRLICTACLKRISLQPAKKRALGLEPFAPALGFLFAWIAFYFIAWVLSRLPSGIWGTG